MYNEITVSLIQQFNHAVQFYQFVNLAVANLEQDLVKGQFEPAVIKVLNIYC